MNICKNLNAENYLSGPGGEEYLNESAFKKNQINITYLKNTFAQEYSQLYPKVGFVNNISALDFILNVGNDWERFYTL